jgi:hypothetical protein
MKLILVRVVFACVVVCKALMVHYRARAVQLGSRLLLAKWTAANPSQVHTTCCCVGHSGKGPGQLHC